MILNHINLSVPDVPAAQALFEAYFDFTVTGKPNDTLCILKGTDGFLLVLISERMNQDGNHGYPDAFHIGFYLANEDEVIRKHEELVKGGVSISQQPQRIRKTFGFYFKFQNLLIEIASEVTSAES